MRGVLLICHIRQNPVFWQALRVLPAASAERCQKDLLKQRRPLRARKTQSSKRFELAVQGTRNKTENQAELTHHLGTSFKSNRGMEQPTRRLAWCAVKLHRQYSSHLYQIIQSGLLKHALSSTDVSQHSSGTGRGFLHCWQELKNREREVAG